MPIDGTLHTLRCLRIILPTGRSLDGDASRFLIKARYALSGYWIPDHDHIRTIIRDISL